MTYWSLILHHWLKYCCLHETGLDFNRIAETIHIITSIYPPLTNPLNSPDGENQGQGRRPEQNSREVNFEADRFQIDWSIHAVKNNHPFDSQNHRHFLWCSVQSHCHGQPHHCLVCSNSSALVLYNLENIKVTCKSGNQITANVKQGLGRQRCRLNICSYVVWIDNYCICQFNQYYYKYWDGSAL